MHQKIFLKNHVPIEEEELIEYIIDGISDRELRNQIRVGGPKIRVSLTHYLNELTCGIKEIKVG